MNNDISMPKHPVVPLDIAITINVIPIFNKKDRMLIFFSSINGQKTLDCLKFGVNKL